MPDIGRNKTALRDCRAGTAQEQQKLPAQNKELRLPRRNSRIARYLKSFVGSNEHNVFSALATWSQDGANAFVSELVVKIGSFRVCLLGDLEFEITTASVLLSDRIQHDVRSLLCNVMQ